MAEDHNNWNSKHLQNKQINLGFVKKNDSLTTELNFYVTRGSQTIAPRFKTSIFRSHKRLSDSVMALTRQSLQ